MYSRNTSRAISTGLRRRAPFHVVDRYDYYFDQFDDGFDDEEGVDLASSSSSACQQAEAAYQAARQVYQQAVESQQNAIRNRGVFGEELIQRLSDRVAQAERALLQAERTRNNACRGSRTSSRSPQSTRTMPRSPSRPLRQPRRSGRSSFDAVDAMFHFDESDIDAATRRPPGGLPNVNCHDMMQSCMANFPRRPGGRRGHAICQDCADACRSLGNLWPTIIPGTRRRCPR